MTDGEAIITYMNMIGYDLSVIGNHEYDIPRKDQFEVLADADFPILSCNIVKRGTDELVDYVVPYIIMERMGIKFGIIGVTTTDTEKNEFSRIHKKMQILQMKKEALKKIYSNCERKRS